MTPDQALDLIADEVTCAALREMIDNGLWDTYIDTELSDGSSRALRDCLVARAAAGPSAAALSAALRLHAQTGHR